MAIDHLDRRLAEGNRCYVVGAVGAVSQHQDFQISGQATYTIVALQKCQQRHGDNPWENRLKL